VYEGTIGRLFAVSLIYHDAGKPLSIVEAPRTPARSGGARCEELPPSFAGGRSTFGLHGALRILRR